MDNFKKYLTTRNIVLAICVIIFCVSAGLLVHKYISKFNFCPRYVNAIESMLLQKNPKRYISIKLL